MLRSPPYKNVKKIILVSIQSCRYLRTLLYAILIFYCFVNVHIVI